ncbi:hypothetical protein HYV88_02615 [Candidatus Woesearchaeota archaeon]|nr:hypothetical protein [Candidatus Woesearchaeota archaeon]
MEELIKRENKIFEILQKFIDENLDFILVGGYAVSAYKHRFSVDADIVINSVDLSKFEIILEKEGFKEVISKDLEDIYGSKFIRYEKDKVSVDILIDALVSRTTNASFSFRLLYENSEKHKITGIEKEILARIPIKELLIVVKLHSGSLTDFRDIATLAKNTDLSLIQKYLFIGDTKKVNENLKNLNRTVNDKNFIDAFKGIFIEKKFDIDMKQVERISNLKK